MISSKFPEVTLISPSVANADRARVTIKEEHDKALEVAYSESQLPPGTVVSTSSGSPHLSLPTESENQEDNTPKKGEDKRKRHLYIADLREKLEITIMEQEEKVN